ncbi:MAG: hypothetical protein AAFQ15_12510, partial [Pseudomonadota bacterium]
MAQAATIPKPPVSVADAMNACPQSARACLDALRALIFETAAATPGVGEIEETLKFPSYQDADLYMALLKILMQLVEIPYKSLSQTDFTEDLPVEYARMARIHDFVERQYARKIYLKE